MTIGPDLRLLDLLGNPATAAEQADIAQAAALRRQEIALRQRAGSAAARLRRAKASDAPREQLAALEALLQARLQRLERTTTQAEAADLMRPSPDPAHAQIFGRALGQVDNPPVTAAAISPEGKVLAAATAQDNRSFLLSAEGGLAQVLLQMSDAKGRMLYRSAEPVSVEAGQVLLVDVDLGAPVIEPGPVPTQPRMPDLVGQSEGVARALLERLSLKAEIADKAGAGEPDIVIAQQPAAGAALSADTRILLTVRRRAAPPPKPRLLPALVGLSQQDAEARLKALGLRAELEPRVDLGPAGIVLAQDPTEGTPLDGLASVRITVAVSPPSEPKTTQVPDLMGRSEASAVDLVKTLGLEPQVAPTNDPAAREGVIGQKPAPGTVVKIGSTVLITVNRPSLPGPAVVAVPDLVGADVGKARQRLQGLGLVATEIQRPATAPLGQVLDQKPQAGAQVKAGSTVALVVSAGPAQKQPALDQLVRTMAAAPGAAKEGLDAQRLAQLFETAGATTIGDARALADLAPTALRDRLALGSVATATRLRAILKKSLTELG